MHQTFDLLSKDICVGFMLNKLTSDECGNVNQTD